MYLQAKTEIVTRVVVSGYVTAGARATMLEPGEGLLVDVEGVYEVDEDGQPSRLNIASNLTASQMDQVEAELVEAWAAANE
jgi:hypothetical protein